MFQNRLPTTRGLKNMEEGKSGPWWMQRKHTSQSSYDYNKAKDPPSSTEHGGCSIDKKQDLIFWTKIMLLLFRNCSYLLYAHCPWWVRAPSLNQELGFWWRMAGCGRNTGFEIRQEPSHRSLYTHSLVMWPLSKLLNLVSAFTNKERSKDEVNFPDLKSVLNKVMSLASTSTVHETISCSDNCSGRPKKPHNNNVTNNSC